MHHKVTGVPGSVQFPFSITPRWTLKPSKVEKKTAAFGGAGMGDIVVTPRVSNPQPLAYKPSILPLSQNSVSGHLSWWPNTALQFFFF